MDEIIFKMNILFSIIILISNIIIANDIHIDNELSEKEVLTNDMINKFSEFIWFDIIPFKFVKKATHNRFSFSYVQAHNVINGIKRFNEILSFTNSPKPNKVQKRTDYNYDENSNSRKS